MILYAYAKCSTCQAAVRYLEKKGVAFTSKEITQTPPTIEELTRMLACQEGQLRKLFNTSGLLYKEMELKDKIEHMPLNVALGLLNEHGMLVKRPFLLGDGFGLLGFNEKKWSEVLSV